jgi:hypothetical protein
MEQQSKTAFLIMDIQAGVVDMFPNTTPLLKNTSKAYLRAREQKIPEVKRLSIKGLLLPQPTNESFFNYQELIP